MPHDETPAPTGEERGQTSRIVIQALDGDSAAAEQLVSRFHPLLVAQARYRMRGRLRKICDPEELVNEVWAAALPNLTKLTPGSRSARSSLLRYLSTTLMNKVNDLLRRQLRVESVRRGGPEDSLESWLGTVPADITTIVTRASRDERYGEVMRCLERLDERDREIVVLKGIEQLPNQVVAQRLGEKESTVAMRYRRALEKLQRILPGSAFFDLESD